MSVHKTKHGWVVRWRQGGKQCGRRLRQADGFTQEDAEAFDHSRKRAKRLGGIDPLAAERDFGDVVAEWWAGHYADIAPTTRDSQRSYLENRILPHFNGERLCDITPSRVRSFRQNLVASGVGEPTQRKVLYTLSAVFIYAQQMDLIVTNPVAPIKVPGAYRQRLIQPFPPERVEKVRQWFLEREDLEGATMVSVLAYSGPPPREAYAGL